MCVSKKVNKVWYATYYMTKKSFQKLIYDWYAINGRTQLPWRMRPTPYRVLVSEIMLQQTQVDRVVPKFQEWMRLFPTVRALAQASARDVLAAWQGLGYNSRALRLQKTAQVMVQDFGGKVPQTRAALESLPGIGPYTAGAILAFAYNHPEVFIETNIRRIYIHHFFKGHGNIADVELLPIIKKTMDTNHPARWYAALMDYGSTLPKIIKDNPNHKSKHYTKQSRFEGSIRQVRGAILRYLLQHLSGNQKQLLAATQQSEHSVQTAVLGLIKDGIVIQKGTRYYVVQ